MQDYWDSTFSRADARSCARKYALLHAIVGEHDRERQRQLLREAAKAWPAALREAQLTPVERLQVRAEFSRGAAARPAAPRAYWAARGFPDVPLWFDLHQMLHDVLRFRRRTRGRTRAAFYDHLSEEGRARWPEQTPLVFILQDDGYALRAVYRCLCWRAGLDHRELVIALFGRSDLPGRVLDGG